MPSLYADIQINAPKLAVWQTLLRKDAWKYWNTFLYDCNPHQPLREGNRVSLSLRRLPGEEETEFSPVVTLIEPEVCVKWVATIPGLKVEQVFELQTVGRDRTYYVHRENFSGVLARVTLPFIRQDELQGIRRMAWELKSYVEQQW